MSGRTHAANSGAIKSNNKELPPAKRKEALFYLPDAIFPWAEQTVRWVLDFFRKLYERSEQDATALREPLRLNELMKARIGSLSKGGGALWTNARSAPV